MRTVTVISVGLVLATLASACDVTEFATPDRVDKHRVLAGSVVVADDPARVTPAPGEKASYRLLVGGRGPQASWTFLLIVCRFLRDETGSPFCDPSLPPVAMSGPAPSTATPPALPQVDFEVPAAESLRPDEAELLMQGLVCPDGPFDEPLLATLDQMDFSLLAAGRNPCADKSKNGVVVAAAFTIQRRVDDRNFSPQIAALSWSELDEKDSEGEVTAGAPWTTTASPEQPDEGCIGQDLLEVPQGKRIGIQVQLDEAARESYQDPSPIPGEAPRMRVEIPQVQGLASAGKFEIVRDNQLEADQLLQLKWVLPKQAKVPDGGRLVRFWLLALDDRSGDAQASSWIERALCVVRQASSSTN